MSNLELWGGHECTVNRVGDSFFDQTRRSGHQDRPSDLDRFAELGLQALRYPVLWERTAPDDPSECDWRWPDERLARIRSLGMRPIVGLVHHGGGPRYTNLLDPEFPQLLAGFAARAAARYPWVEEWTPVNEPLTTARFSALYGLWHPHLRDEGAFWTALLNQVDAVSLAMTQIRRVNPAARLVQTEDLGRTYATAPVAHQAEYDNARRWMTWDLLCGRVSPEHPLFNRLSRFGLGDRLRGLADRPCAPDVIGVNHYLTSDRFLDHRIERYPPERRGGNRFVAFADVEAIRVAVPAPQGLEGALEEAWDRYGLPIAVTECHNGCTREEQARWLREGWETCEQLRLRGVDVRALTAWALLGSHDWNSLLTREAGHYETGAFDVRTGEPRRTGVADELARLAAGEPPHPAADGPGWWRRDIRLEHQPVNRTADTPEPRRWWRHHRSPGGALLITGATGTLGKAFALACERRGLEYRLTSRSELALDDEGSIARCLDETGAWAVVNAAGWVRVDVAEDECEACHAANAQGAALLAMACAQADLPFVGFSSDLVFDGRAGRPYVESDATSPLNVYGASKAAAERSVLEIGGKALMVRTAAFFSPYDPHNFANQAFHRLAASQPFEAACDLHVSPTYVPDLTDCVLDLLIDGDTGLRHVTNEGALSWAAFARALAGVLGLDADLVRERPASEMGLRAPRPAFTPLATERGRIMCDIDEAIARYASVVRGRGAELNLEEGPARGAGPGARQAAPARPGQEPAGLGRAQG